MSFSSASLRLGIGRPDQPQQKLLDRRTMVLPAGRAASIPLKRTRQVLMSLFFIFCVFFNSVIDENRNFYASHAAIIVLFGSGLLVRLLSTRQAGRLDDRIPTRRDAVLRGKLLMLLFLPYYAARAFEASANPWFFGELAKIGLIIVAVLAYRLLDPHADCFSTWTWFLPAIVAVTIVIRVVTAVLQGNLFSQRLAVETIGSAVALGYISGTLWGFCLSLLHTVRERWKFLVFCLITAVIAGGVVLAFARNGMLAALIAFCVYTWHSSGRRGRKLVLFLLIGAICGVAVNYTVAEVPVIERFNIIRNPDLGGREAIWQDWTDLMLKDTATVLCGSGLGSAKPINPGTGDFSRNPHNAFLDVAVSFGLIGLSGYVLLLVAIYRKILRQPRDDRRNLALALFWAYVATDLFDCHWRESLILWYTALLFYIFTSSYRGAGQPRLPSVKRGVASVFASHPIRRRSAMESQS